MSRLLRVKPMSMLSKEAGEQGEHTLKRSLGAMNLITLGIGAIIGAGIFVLTGQAAALHAGPAVALSFVLAGVTCAFAGLCYAEFASIIPIAGSAYTYGYATLGEFVAWIIGWDLGLEYGFGAATVASGWSGYFNSLLQQLHIYLPPRLTATPGTVLVFFHEHWLPLASLPPGTDAVGLPHVTALFNLVAILAILGRDRRSGDRHQGVGQSELGDCDRQAGRSGRLPGSRNLFPDSSIPQLAKLNWHPVYSTVRWARQLRLGRDSARPQLPSFSRTSASTLFPRRPRKPRIRSGICLSASSVRW